VKRESIAALAWLCGTGEHPAIQPEFNQCKPGVPNADRQNQQSEYVTDRLFGKVRLEASACIPTE
jgi:hypothetical protein